ncbi:MAG: glycerol kinase GlpK [Roseburia sp.]|nr:glycerol kinase GlpK [Roseburia sp.]MCM1098576.1 glycerol kinase GlpK [Ruminococcus flavefaciens]
MKYILGIDQSTQGTKAVLFDGAGLPVSRADIPHRQLINGRGWVSHDPEEIYRNVIRAVGQAVKAAGVSGAEIEAVGICNQRETTVLWEKSGAPLAGAVVWQCGRAASVTERLKEYGAAVYEKTGIPLSPYFPAAKMTWLLEQEAGKLPSERELRLGTVDSWLVYRLTGGASFQTDYSNASRTQLFHLETLEWDRELCGLFGVSMEALPRVCDSNSCFGSTDFEGLLERKVPILAVLGDSHAALYGQGCHQAGMVKTTYGTGSSIMMNTGEKRIRSKNGLVSSLAWGIDGKVAYVLEGNINYTGAVVTWLKDDMKLIERPEETAALAETANPGDGTILVPAFTGLSAPYWREDARALLWGMSRTTGRAEIVKAALESIAYQITDVLKAMEQDSGQSIRELRADGGAAKNSYLMQFQGDLSGTRVNAAENNELSVTGAAYLAGITAGLWRRETLFGKARYRRYVPEMESAVREEKRARWQEALRRA